MEQILDLPFQIYHVETLYDIKKSQNYIAIINITQGMPSDKVNLCFPSDFKQSSHGILKTARVLTLSAPVV